MAGTDIVLVIAIVICYTSSPLRSTVGISGGPTHIRIQLNDERD